MQKMEKGEKQKIIVSGILLLTSGVLQLMARRTAWFGSWYVTRVYPVLSGVFSRFFGLLPFSVVEIGLYLLIAGILLYGFLHRKAPQKTICQILLIVSALLFTYTCNCGVNYYAESFSSLAGLPVQQSSADELYDLCEYLLGQARENETTESYAANKTSWKREGVAAMNRLGEQFPSLRGYYPMPKEAVFSDILSVQQLGGVYSPFTIEANFNGDMPSYNIPHTICHELSHLRGFMREDEANFIGYLACIGSESQAFRYSGYLTGWVYAGNALAKVDIARYMELYEDLSEQMEADLAENSAFWRQYDGAIAEVSNQMNDAYLKINDQHDGVQSYGRMVDLMLTYYREY